MPTALVVDDSKTDRHIVSSYLTGKGVAVTVATNGEEAVSTLGGQAFDLIVLDVVLPDRSGFDLCRYIREESNLPDVPVIICSTKGTDMDKFWGMKQGANAYLEKPVDQEEFTETLSQLLGV